MCPTFCCPEASCTLLHHERSFPPFRSDVGPPACSRAATAKGHLEDKCSALRRETDQQMRDVQVRTTLMSHASVAVIAASEPWSRKKGEGAERMCANRLRVTWNPELALVQANCVATTHALEDGLEAAHCQLVTMQARAEAAEAQCAAAEASVASALADRTSMEAVNTPAKAV